MHSNSVEYFAVTEAEESEESPIGPSPLKPKMTTFINVNNFAAQERKPYKDISHRTEMKVNRR